MSASACSSVGMRKSSPRKGNRREKNAGRVARPDGVRAGALALGDIGKFFPDNDPKFKNADSILLLREILSVVSEKGYNIVNIDATVVAQKPKLRDYIDKIRENFAKELGIPLDCVSVKATTEEKLGFTGNMEGMKSYCVVLLSKK